MNPQDFEAEAQAVAFGPFVLDAANARLTRHGQVIALPPRPLALLAHLARHPGELVTKDHLLDAVWGHRHVSESVLKGSVNTLRKALGDEAKAPLWIETVPRHGYRFVAVLQPVATAAAGPGATGQPAPAAGNLPPPGTPLLGRDGDLQALPALLAEHRLVTLAGSGGIGKTRLALAVAAACQDRFSDGAWIVRLDAVDALDGSLALVASIARSLRLSAEAARSAESLAAALGRLSLLLVLDNCEHVLEATATLAQGLLAQASGLRLLVTSQEPLRLQGEQVWRVGPLSWPAPGDTATADRHAAVALFVQRVRALDPAFVLSPANRGAVCELCARLDGLPLALELAAARVPLLGVDGVLDRLQERLELLTQGPRDAPARQRTLRATLAWSHALLTPEQRVVLRRLAVFGGSFSLAAAQAVVADPGQPGWGVVDALGALVEKSLIVSVAAPAAAAGGAQRRRRGDGERNGPASAQPTQRMRLFDSIRSFAAEQLQDAGETQTLRSRHAEWMLGLLQAASAQAHDTPLLEWTAALLPEVDNLRAALRHALPADPALAVALVSHATVFWQRAALKHEALRWQTAVLPLFSSAALPAPLRAGFLQARAWLCFVGMLGLPADHLELLHEALRLHDQAGDTLNQYVDLYLLAHATLRLEPDGDTRAVSQRMAQLEAADWSPMRRRYARMIPAIRLRDTGDTEAYRRFCTDEIQRAHQAHDRSGVWTWSYGLALAEHDQGDAQRAIDLLHAAVRGIHEAGCLREFPHIVALRASMLLEQGDPGLFLPAAQQAVRLLRAEAMLWWMAGALAFAPLWLGRPDDAARVLGWADALLARRGERPGLFFGRLRSVCESRLQQALGAAAMASACAAGAVLDDETALALAFGPAFQS